MSENEPRLIDTKALDEIQEAHEKLLVRLKVYGNQDDLVKLVHIFAKSKREHFWESVVSLESIKGFFNDPVSLYRNKGSDYDNIIKIAKAICAAAGVICPYINDLGDK